MPGSVSADTEAQWRSLSGIPLLAGLPDDQLRTLWTDSLARDWPAGDALRNAGDPASHLVLLLRGRVAATAATRSGRVVRFGEWSGPCALDKVAVIDGHGHTATFTALTPCSIRTLPRDRFLAAIDDVPSVRGHVLRVLAGQARSQQEKLTATATMPAEARLAAWLLNEAASDAGGSVRLPGTQQVLADLLGVTRVTVNRALSRLRRDGLIEFDRRTVTVLAPELLALRTHG
ncbi:Crp/Fnr family transcriptional regulator [Streptomyces sp. WMMB 322]|uniref:Crp/Fnr family transcriptional regulator n=1 Tax=Streptomyces sp. WMMB 322 TaxID=1286821 RepID=UPI0008237D0A|nr:Crp/Fnr family transcriptional regulator [Streptomyces sp. WMMB 322]SCK10196.1 cAMP-binding domain of CRP or a regulatory subunit of cAMP-dependent protein kinases [Streptomyces sp. WMMB 322]